MKTTNYKDTSLPILIKESSSSKRTSGSHNGGSSYTGRGAELGSRRATDRSTSSDQDSSQGVHSDRRQAAEGALGPIKLAGRVGVL